MRDFTLKAYKVYLKLLAKKYSNIITFDQYFSAITPPNTFCILRHDVDRNPENALKMARIEHDMGICSTYYFRTKRHVFKSGIIRKIKRLGHEIGYHYESWADYKGDPEKSLFDFEQNLKRLRCHVPVNTIAMHGRPLTGFDNRDLWKNEHRENLLNKHFNIKGEVYLHIDYSNIAYISDTGRNWTCTDSNIQDRVVSNISMHLSDKESLLKYLRNPHPKMILLTHPERWCNNLGEYFIQTLKDYLINLLKSML